MFVGIAIMGILCCRITIGNASPSNPMRIQDGVEIMEAQSLETDESYKKLIGTAKVIFPKESVCRPTIIGSVTLEDKDVSRITTEVMQDGAIIKKRSVQRLADETTFKVRQRVNIRLGYNGALKNMFDGYITGYSSDNTLETQCENMAYKLKLKQAPHFEAPAKGVTMNEVLEGRYSILKDTSFRIHSDTKRFEIHIDKVKAMDSFMAADILSEWSKYEVYCSLKYDAGGNEVIPPIAVRRLYSSNEIQSVFLGDRSAGPYRIHFNEHVVQSNLGVIRADSKFLTVTGKALGTDEKLFEVTVRMNPEYDPATPGSKEFQTVNATQISKKTHKVTGNTTTLGAKARAKVDLSAYTIVPYMPPRVGINSDWLIEEITEHFRDYNLSGIAGDVIIFGDFGPSLAVQAELIDYRNPSRSGVYLVEEVATTFGVDGYRQQLSIPYKTRK